MQVMFQKQHFGRLAVGLSNVNVFREQHIAALNEEQFATDRDKFYSVSSGGISHPWTRKQDEVRVAMTGDGMIFDENDPTSVTKVRVYAKIEFMDKGEVYLTYNY